MQLSFPGEAEFSAHSAQVMLSQLQLATSQPLTSFSDGQYDGYSKYGYVSSALMITHPVTDEQFSRMAGLQEKIRQTSLAWTRKQKRAQSSPSVTFEMLNSSDPKGVAWRVNGSYALLNRISQSVLWWRVSTRNQDDPAEEAYTAKAFTAVNNATSRPMFLVPHQPGVCLPYIFIPDEGVHPRGITMVYRLKSHPDITIMLEDQNGGPIPTDVDPDKFTSEYDNDYFWTYQHPKYIRSLWKDPLHSIELAGIKGQASLVKLTHEDDDDNEVNYGFFAAARDNSDSPDATNLRMFVIRDAKVARAKNIEPMGKEEFIELAQTIAASVKRRPTTN
jgi:hypothetical protein